LILALSILVAVECKIFNVSSSADLKKSFKKVFNSFIY